MFQEFLIALSGLLLGSAGGCCCCCDSQGYTIHSDWTLAIHRQPGSAFTAPLAAQAVIAAAATRRLRVVGAERARPVTRPLRVGH